MLLFCRISTGMLLDCMCFLTSRLPLNSPKGRNKVSHHPNRGLQPAAPQRVATGPVYCVLHGLPKVMNLAQDAALTCESFIWTDCSMQPGAAHWPISGAFSIPGIAPNWKCASDKLTGTSGSKGHCGQHIRILRWLRRTLPTLPRTSW